MLRKYQMLLRSSERRLQADERALVQLRAKRSALQGTCAGLMADIVLQQQLARAGDLNGAALNRQQLFTWLRNSAADKRKTQALRLELHQQQALSEDCSAQIGLQQVRCKQRDGKCQQYQLLVRSEHNKLLRRERNTEESDTEERIAWSI